MGMHTRKRSRADIVHDKLRHLIVTLQLEPGQPLPGRELCERFRSAEPLREAILRLAEHGLVMVAPQARHLCGRHLAAGGATGRFHAREPGDSRVPAACAATCRPI